MSFSHDVLAGVLYSHDGACLVGAGFLGQTVFFMRFLVRWLMAERRREKRHAILGQVPGILVYLRNPHFIHDSQPSSCHIHLLVRALWHYG
jgi:lipid-A-disaccharide synthase-like uncharacterized protein